MAAKKKSVRKRSKCKTLLANQIKENLDDYYNGMKKR